MCHRTKVQLCNGCQTTYYCSQDHQARDWETHKRSCPGRTYYIEKDQTGDKWWVAFKDFAPGDIITEEKPIFHLPDNTQGTSTWNTVGIPSLRTVNCLTCSRILIKPMVPKCTKCGWPCCSENCENVRIL